MAPSLMFWREYSDKAPRNTQAWACSPRGWLFARASKPGPNDYGRIIWDDSARCWREASALGNAPAGFPERRPRYE